MREREREREKKMETGGAWCALSLAAGHIVITRKHEFNIRPGRDLISKRVLTLNPHIALRLLDAITSKTLTSLLILSVVLNNVQSLFYFGKHVLLLTWEKGCPCGVPRP